MDKNKSSAPDEHMSNTDGPASDDSSATLSNNTFTGNEDDDALLDQLLDYAVASNKSQKSPDSLRSELRIEPQEPTDVADNSSGTGDYIYGLRHNHAAQLQMMYSTGQRVNLPGPTGRPGARISSLNTEALSDSDTRHVRTPTSGPHTLALRTRGRPPSGPVVQGRTQDTQDGGDVGDAQEGRDGRDRRGNRDEPDAHGH